MTFNDNARIGGTTAKRRGAGIAVAGGGVAGIGALAVLLLGLFTGGDFSSLLGPALGGAGGSEDTAITGCDTGEAANEDDTCRLVFGAQVIDEYWAQNVDGYRAPQLIIVEGQAQSTCGTASNQTGPFYCPPDEAVFIDPTFFDLLRQRFGASGGDLAQLYVLAHEYGHHVQNIAGIMDRYPNNGTGPDSNGVRTELQADCFAGAWVGSASQQLDAYGEPYLKPPTDAEIADALNAAQVVGDDHIQQSSGGYVNPETWTHGSSDQRQRWFTAGYEGGLGACDTFAVSGGSL